METRFDFEKYNNEYTHNIDLQTILHIKRISHSVALLYFTDEMNNNTNIPNDIIVYTYDYENNNKILIKPTMHYFPLCWTDDYTIIQNEKLLLNIRKQRKWNIISYK